MGISLSLLQTWDLQYTVGNYFYLLLFIYFSVFTINYQYKRAHKCFFITLKTFYWDSKHVHIWVWKHCTEKICEAIKNYNRWRVVCFSKGANDAIPYILSKTMFCYSEYYLAWESVALTNRVFRRETMQWLTCHCNWSTIIFSNTAFLFTRYSNHYHNNNSNY